MNTGDNESTLLRGMRRAKSVLRDVTLEERGQWHDAIQERTNVKSSMKPDSMENARALIRNRNPLRWRRFQKDVRWVRKEMVNLGLNPEDVMFLL